jgi:regulator of protease activity HflC (stomatin/prohibitin superfamily)
MKKALLLTMLLATTGCSETINPGEVGVCVDWGQVQNWTYPEGFHWTGGMGVDVLRMSTRTMSYEMGSSGTPGAEGEAQEAGVERGDAVAVRSRDQLEVTIAATIQFHLSGASAPAIYRLYGMGYADTIIHPNVRTSIRDTAASFTAINLIDQRAEFQDQLETRILSQLRTTLKARGVPENAIVIEAILVQNIDLPTELDASINAVVVERQGTARQDQARLTALANAARLRAEADGEATALTIRATAEAGANRIRSESLTPAVLRARQIELMGDLLRNEHTRTLMVPIGNSPLFTMPTTVE